MRRRVKGRLKVDERPLGARQEMRDNVGQGGQIPTGKSRRFSCAMTKPRSFRQSLLTGGVFASGGAAE